MRFRFRTKYALGALFFLLVEVFIALFIHDRIIRPYVGDLLVVILIYCFLKSFWNAPVLTVALSVLVFSYTVEALQYFKLITRLGLQNSKLAIVILGNAFHWLDILAYTLGIGAVLLSEKIVKFNHHHVSIKS